MTDRPPDAMRIHHMSRCFCHAICSTSSCALTLSLRTLGNNDVEDFHVTSGILRLSTKYAIDKLRDLALAHLTTAWPNTLDGWDAREEIAREYEFDTGQPLYPSPIVSAHTYLVCRSKGRI